MSNIATLSGVQWDKPNRSVTDDEAATVLANHHPKARPAPVRDADVLPGSPGSGEAPGANGPPTTGPVIGGDPMGSI